MTRPDLPAPPANDVWAAQLNAGIYDVSDRVDSVQALNPGGGDDTARINAWLANSNTTTVKVMVGSFTVSDAVAVPAGLALDLTRATITQTGSNKTTLNLGDRAKVYGGLLIGKGTDYVANASPSAFGISTSNTDGVSILGTRFVNFSGAGIRALTAINVEISGVTIIGVGAPTIASGHGGPCNGILLDSSTDLVSISDSDISAACQGVLAGLTVTRLRISNVRVHDIPGQHGLYLQNGTGLTVDGLTVSNTYLNGMKVQLSAGSTTDSRGTVIGDYVANNCADNALILYNIAPDLSTGKKFYGVTISNMSATDCGRGLYLGSIRGVAVSNLTVSNCLLDAVTVLDTTNLEASAWVIDTCGRIGIRVSLATGSVQDNLHFSGIRIHNAANANVASNIWGIYHLQGSNVTFDEVKVTADNGFMQYAYFLASATKSDQETFTLRDADLSGSISGQDIRLLAGPVRVRGWTNVRAGTAVLNFPTGFATRIGSRGQSASYIANVIPTADTFKVGDEVVNGNPVVGQPKAWLCTVAGGLHNGAWAATTAYALGDWRRTTAGRVFECTTAGTSGATEPVATTVGQTVTDGTVTWTCRVLTVATLVSTGNL